jgi:hypothetical protein
MNVRILGYDKSGPINKTVDPNSMLAEYQNNPFLVDFMSDQDIDHMTIGSQVLGFEYNFRKIAEYNDQALEPKGNADALKPISREGAVPQNQSATGQTLRNRYSGPTRLREGGS